MQVRSQRRRNTAPGPAVTLTRSNNNGTGKVQHLRLPENFNFSDASAFSTTSCSHFHLLRNKSYIHAEVKLFDLPFLTQLNKMKDSSGSICGQVMVLRASHCFAARYVINKFPLKTTQRETFHIWGM